MNGKGNITVNGMPLDEYFGEETLKVIVKQPLTVTNTLDKFDVVCTVKGGGFLRSSWSCSPWYRKSIKCS